MADPPNGDIDFNFPHKPYGIQSQFMNSLYNVLEEGKIGIFESPTGTGKSLSIICGALRWLQNFDAKLKERIIETTKDRSTGEPSAATDRDWVKSAVQKSHEGNRDYELKKLIDGREMRKGVYKKLREHPIDAKSIPPFPIEHLVTRPNRKNEEDETSSGDSCPESEHSSEENSDTEACRLEAEHGVKIIYCSRTHSQLSQFMHELGKTSYGQSIQAISLGSRQGLCVHPIVSKLKSLQEINDRCLELRTKTKSSDKPRVKRMKESTPKGCPFSAAQRVSQLRDQSLAQPLDIESLVQKGRSVNTCAYYASRQALKYAQLIVMPYQLLLHERTRNAIGLNLTGQIVVLDEAHNLPEAISNVYSSMVTLSQLRNAHSSLQNYKDRYQARLNPRNLLNVKQLLFVLQALVSFLQQKDSPSQEVISQTEFCFKAGIDHLNMFKLITFCRKNKLSQKLMGFIDRDVSSEMGVSLSSPLLSIESFLESLCNFEEDGRIIVDRQQEGSIKFLLLNAGRKFTQAICDVRALMIVGGTLEPIEEFHRLLLGDNCSSSIERERLVHFSCGHVVRKEQISPIVITAGPSKMEFDFSYQNRTPKMLEELSRTFVNLVNIIPKGIVVFFPSYAFLSTCLIAWRDNGTLEQISSKKVVFQEPKGSGIEDVLSAYTRSVALTPGAVIFAVVGGKLSEGMNFSDDLARAVIMIGLPYPNIESPELKEKMCYIDSQTAAVRTCANRASQEFYENLCMKAVNQSIGRSIRHIGDYSCVLFLDRRYAREQVLRKLPSWIKSNVQVCGQFGQAVGLITKFYKTNVNA